MKPNWIERLFFGQNLWAWSDFAHRFTGGKYLLAARPDVSKWQRWEHELTKWRHFILPEGDVVDVFKFREPVKTSKVSEWPEMIRDQVIDFRDPSKVNHFGQGSGTPMQQCGNETRPLTYGYAEWGKQEHTRIPAPTPADPNAPAYWVRGYPTPAYDRHWTGVAPDGSVHECIQLDPNAEPTLPPFPNQALGWAKYVDGVKVAGTGATVLGLPSSAYTWDFNSSKNPHQLWMVLCDYIGGDGARQEGSAWPTVGKRYCLDRNSESYKAGIAEGGECAAFIEAAATYGCKLGDRNGYVDTGHKVGTQPRAPHLSLQAGRQWATTNIHKARIRLGDLREVTE
jgi:hypothetical protein